VGLTTGTGALLLFGAVQVVMIAAGFFAGERIDRTVVVGWLLAVAGLILLLLPGIAAPPALDIFIGEQSQCSERYAGKFLGVKSQQVMDAAHFLSAGVVSFARGLNDTPKIAALLLVVKVLDIHWGLVAVAVAIALGGLLNAKKVAETMSLKITAMNHGQGFSANLSTGILVILASKYGLPVSTTHVSVGSLFGIGLTTGKANLRVVLGILLSWLLTMPCAALIAALVYWLIRRS